MKDLIRKILKEETYKKSIENLLRRYGLEKARIVVGGNKKLLKHLGINKPEDYFNIIVGPKTPIETKSDRFVTFDDKYGNLFFMYDKISKNVTTFAKTIDTLKNMMGLQYTGGSEIFEPLKNWISETYNIEVRSINDFDISELEDENDLDIYIDFLNGFEQ